MYRSTYVFHRRRDAKPSFASSLIFFSRSQLACVTGPLAFTPVSSLLGFSQPNWGWGGPNREQKNHLLGKIEGDTPTSSNSQQRKVCQPSSRASDCGRTSPTPGPCCVLLPALTHILAEATGFKSPTSLVPISLRYPALHFLLTQKATLLLSIKTPMASTEPSYGWQTGLFIHPAVLLSVRNQCVLWFCFIPSCSGLNSGMKIKV